MSEGPLRTEEQREETEGRGQYFRSGGQVITAQGLGPVSVLSYIPVPEMKSQQNPVGPWNARHPELLGDLCILRCSRLICCAWGPRWRARTI